MIFTDVVMEDNLMLASDHNVTTTLLTLIYDSNADVLNNSNYVDVFEMMDKYLMKEYFNIMLVYGKNNITDIVNGYILSGDFDKIKLLHRILKNISDENSINNNDELKKNTKEVIKKMFDGNFNEHITMFEDWTTLFTDPQKLRCIHNSKQYDLLNVACINVDLVINFLSKLDLNNDDYDELFTLKNLYRCLIMFGDDKSISKHKIIIDSYYPVFKYRKILRYQFDILQVDKNVVTIKFNINSDQLNKGAQIMANDTVYRVVDIIRCNNDFEKATDKACYVSNKDVCFKLILDDNYVVGNGSISSYEECMCTVQL
jgi:hypothetical protein